MSAETIDTQAVQSDENEKLKTTEEEDKKEKTKQRLEALYKEYYTAPICQDNFPLFHL